MAKTAIIGTVGQLLTGLMILLVVACASGGTSSDPRAPSEDVTNVDRALIELRHEFVRFLETNDNPEQFVAQHPQLRIVDGRVMIDAVAEASVAELVNNLTALGATHITSYDRVVSCLFPIDRLHLLESVETLQFARPALAATRPRESIRK